MFQTRETAEAFAKLCHAAKVAGLPAPVLDPPKFEGTDLRDANLRFANLHGVSMRRMHFQGADLTNANLTGADLFASTFTKATLAGATLAGANLLSCKGIVAVGPVGFRGHMLIGVAHPGGPRVQADTFWGTVDELRASLDEQYPVESNYRAPYLLALDWICAALAVDCK